LLREAREIWVPSNCTGLRTTQWWGLHNWSVILSSCPWWDSPVEDKGYLLCTLRKIPDPWCDQFDESCSKLGIPYKRPNHEASYTEYQELVAGCRGLVNHYYEASTGGLTLLEAYRLGKPCLCSDSQWNGASDYLQNRADYFHFGNVQDFENKLQNLWESPPSVPRDCREWVETKFSSNRVINDMLRRIEAIV